MITLNRRQFLATSSAFAGMSASAGFANSPPTNLIAQKSDVQLLPGDYGKTSLWCFDGSSPGPEIRVAQGGRVQRRLVNRFSQGTSTHWHGIRIDNAMDGVSGLTQDAVQPGNAFDYDFIVPDAGTYWYHAHNRSLEQVARGLYGALIVEEAEALDIDREEVLILDDWRINPETAQIQNDFGAPRDLSHAGRLGNLITTNGTFNLALSARRNERLRLRLVNASNARNFQLSLDGLDGWMVALDGMPLTAPLKVTDTMTLAPAQRIDLIVDVAANVGETAHIVQVGREETFSQVAFEVEEGGTVNRRDAPAALPPNDHAMVDLQDATTLSLSMEGGAMGRLSSASLGGEIKPMGELVQAGYFWSFNGKVDGIDGEPFARLDRGQNVRLKMVNDTVFPHAMHLHGMHFHEVAEDGTLGPLRDTTLLERGETREVAFVADNPGQWLLHCHMLSHAASGMMTKIVVG